MTSTRPSASADEIHALLTRWQNEGLLDAAEVVRIEAAEAARQPLPAAGRTAGALLGEALGYAGGALIVAAVGVFLGRSWGDMQFATQVALATAAAVALLVAGFFVPDRMGSPARRLQAVLWSGSTGLAFGTWMLIAGEDGFDWRSHQMLVFSAALATPMAALLWWRSRHVLLHLTTFAALATLVSGLCADIGSNPDQATGLALSLFGVIWVTLALADLVRPPLAAYLAGSIVAVLASISTTDARWGAVYALAMAAGVIALAVWRRSLPILAVGTVGVLIAVPNAADRLFHGSMSVVLGLLVAGVVLVASALWITRHPEKRPVTQSKAPSSSGQGTLGG